MQLTGVTFKKLQRSLAVAPWGYHLQGKCCYKDWRSWKAFFNETFCLASIALQQEFPATLCVCPRSD